MKRIAPALLVLLPALLAAAWWANPPGQAPAVAAARPQPLALAPAAITRLLSEAEAAVPADPETDAERAAFQQFIDQPPASLADLPPPAPVQVNASGELVVNAQLRLLFEHYLSALGEESLTQVLVRIRHALAQQLTSEALDQGLALLDAYVQFRNQQGIIRADYEQLAAGAGFSLDQIRAMKLAERQARQQLFSDAHSQALFGQQDQIEDALLERLAIQADASLNQQQRQQQLNAVGDELTGLVASEHQQQVQSALADDAQLLAEATGTEDLDLYRQQRFGPAVAQRLAARDQAREHWQSRVASYRTQLLPLLIHKPVDPQLLADLRRDHFSGPELTRIAALDKMELDF